MSRLATDAGRLVVAGGRIVFDVKCAACCKSGEVPPFEDPGVPGFPWPPDDGPTDDDCPSPCSTCEIEYKSLPCALALPDRCLVCCRGSGVWWSYERGRVYQSYGYDPDTGLLMWAEAVTEVLCTPTGSVSTNTERRWDLQGPVVTGPTPGPACSGHPAPCGPATADFSWPWQSLVCNDEVIYYTRRQTCRRLEWRYLRDTGMSPDGGQLIQDIRRWGIYIPSTDCDSTISDGDCPGESSALEILKS